MTPDNKGQPLDGYCRDQRVVAVSPNTLYAHLCVIAMGLRGMQVEENARRLLASLRAWKNRWRSFEKFGVLGTHLKNAQQSYSESDKLFEKAHDTLQGVLGAGTGDPALENVQGTLALSAESERQEKR